jgi:hypothetical protein
LVAPKRTSGTPAGTRIATSACSARSRASQESGINLAGVKAIIGCRPSSTRCSQTDELEERLRERQREADTEGKIVPLASVFLPP